MNRSLICALALASWVCAAAPGQPFLAHLQAAQGALERSEVRTARAWLDRVPRRHRDWEWRVLRARSDQSIASRAALEEGGRALAWSPEGTFLAAGGEEGTIQIWRADGVLVKAWPGHNGPVTGLDLHGDLLATSGRDKAVKVWRLPEGLLVADLKGHTQGAYGVALSPDGKRVASPGWRREQGAPIGCAYVWDLDRPDAPRRLDWTSHPLASARWSPDGARLYLGGWDHRSRVWDTANWAGLHEFATEANPTYRAVDALAVSPDHRLLATACRDRKVRIFEAATGKLERILEGHHQAVTDVAFAPDGKRLATASADGALRVFEAPHWDLALTLNGHVAKVRSLAWGPGGNLASLDQAGELRFWDPAKTAGPTLRHGAYAWGLALSPDGREVVTTGGPGDLKRFDATTETLLSTWPAHAGYASALAWSRDGRRILSGANAGNPMLWDVKTGSRVAELKGHTAGVTEAAAGSGFFVTLSLDKTLRTWDVETGRALQVFKPANPPSGLALLAGGKIASGAEDGSVQVWDAKTSGAPRVWPGFPKGIRSLAVAPGGRRLAVGSVQGRLNLLDFRSGTRRALPGHPSEIQAMAWRPDGRRLATCDADQTLKIWEPDTGEELLAFRDLGASPYRLAWSPDGESLWVLFQTPGQARVIRP